MNPTICKAIEQRRVLDAGWKLLKIKDAALVHLAETVFEPRPEYTRNDKVVIKVFCQV